jgi:glutamyl-tRNA reductase
LQPQATGGQLPGNRNVGASERSIERAGLQSMKIGIVGTGTVGCACAMAAVNRGSAREIVLVNRTRKTAEAVAADPCVTALR